MLEATCFLGQHPAKFKAVPPNRAINRLPTVARIGLPVLWNASSRSAWRHDQVTSTAKTLCVLAPLRRRATFAVSLWRHACMVTKTEFNAQQGCVVFAKNKKRVSAFYQQTLALEIGESERTHDLLLGPGYEVVVHSIPRKHAANIEIASPALPRDATPFKPTFMVPYLEAVRVAATETGGYLKPRARAWRFRGCIVLDCWDPEGNIVQFKERG